MESPVVVDKPPEYHGNSKNSDERGFPFDEEDSAGAWSSLAARHPDIAARLRQRPATWARKRRPPSQTSADDFDENFEGFDRFPFDDIPPEFREHFPSHWNRGFGSREEQPHGAPPPHQQQQQQHQPQQQPSSPQQQTTSTQTEQSEPEQPHLPQYGLRNTVDLGQKSAADPSLVDADERNQRSMSAPPDNRTMNQEHQAPEQPASNVRHIPIFVEGRDEPVINKNVDHGAHYADPKPQYASPPQHPQQPHIDREQYFADDGPTSFHHAPNFSRAFGTPFNKNYRQGPQPFVHQKVYPQAAFARGASPARSESPKPQHSHDEHYKNVPVHHEPPKPEPSRAQQRPQPPQPPQRQPSPQQQPPPPQQQAPPQPKPQPSMNDPISIILSIQTDVLNLMSEVENFAGAKNDKQYLFLDEMLTRNLIKLDNIETDGKENIRQARKEAIKCIQKCIAVLEAKAESNSKAAKGADVEMKEKPAAENGEVTNEATKDEAKAELGATEPKPEADKTKEAEPTPVPSDTRPEDKAPGANAETAADTKQVDNKPSPKKGAKGAKKREKSKDNADKTQESTSDEKQEAMQVDDKGDKTEPQTMDVDGASASQ